MDSEARPVEVTVEDEEEDSEVDPVSSRPAPTRCSPASPPMLLGALSRGERRTSLESRARGGGRGVVEM